MCRGLRQEGAFATVCARELRVLPSSPVIYQKGGQEEEFREQNERAVLECRFIL